MQSKGNQPTAHAKRWQQAVRDAGCIITGSDQIHLHHIWGASFKIGGGIWVGQYAVLSYHHLLHMNGELNVTDHKKAFHDKYGSNADHFEKTLQLVAENNQATILPPQQVIEAILKWGGRN